ncbi:MAG: putative flavin-dependent thymidylate synthase [Prokaryotic dsDNA virus sp.]|nr:MAG: putative flavin-dependent thymidylate synthase [Prokaryotic dsDNA virus sp.]|tara:strand:- start:51709 stop:52383 length:675 start_codon:yes stop_codon:yes gene_type:complete
MFDFNKVRTIGVTLPVCDDIPDSEGILSFAARVSSPNNQQNFETAGKLLQYCVKHKHYSVFETCNVVMEIETPRDIARQILRHRSFSFQEFSQRYAEAQQFITRECRLQDNKNRQNSLELSGSDEENLVAHWWECAQAEVTDLVTELYERALVAGIAKEVARCILPEGLTMSKMYMNGTVRSWLHFIQVRDDEGVAQKEVVDVARKAKVELLKHFPFLEEMLEK